VNCELQLAANHNDASPPSTYYSIDRTLNVHINPDNTVQSCIKRTTHCAARLVIRILQSRYCPPLRMPTAFVQFILGVNKDNSFRVYDSSTKRSSCSKLASTALDDECPLLTLSLIAFETKCFITKVLQCNNFSSSVEQGSP
jgi:hypothetical protein